MEERLILVVDDDPLIRELVARALEGEGYRVKTATNGAEALATIGHARPALVVLDMEMPVVDGCGFAKRLKERGVKIPILLMSAATNVGRRAKEIGAKAYLTKPFELIALFRAVKRLVQLRRPRRSLHAMKGRLSSRPIRLVEHLRLTTETGRNDNAAA